MSSFQDFLQSHPSLYHLDLLESYGGASSTGSTTGNSSPLPSSSEGISTMEQQHRETEQHGLNQYSDDSCYTEAANVTPPMKVARRTTVGSHTNSVPSSSEATLTSQTRVANLSYQDISCLAEDKNATSRNSFAVPPIFPHQQVRDARRCPSSGSSSNLKIRDAVSLDSSNETSSSSITSPAQQQEHYYSSTAARSSLPESYFHFQELHSTSEEDLLPFVMTTTTTASDSNQQLFANVGGHSAAATATADETSAAAESGRGEQSESAAAQPHHQHQVLLPAFGALYPPTSWSNLPNTDLSQNTEQNAPSSSTIPLQHQQHFSSSAAAATNATSSNSGADVSNNSLIRMHPQLAASYATLTQSYHHHMNRNAVYPPVSFSNQFPPGFFMPSSSSVVAGGAAGSQNQSPALYSSSDLQQQQQGHSRILPSFMDPFHMNAPSASATGNLLNYSLDQNTYAKSAQIHSDPQSSYEPNSASSPPGTPLTSNSCFTPSHVSSVEITKVSLRSFTSNAMLNIRELNKLLDVRQDKLFCLFIDYETKNSDAQAAKLLSWHTDQDVPASENSFYLEMVGIRFKKDNSKKSTNWKRSPALRQIQIRQVSLDEEKQRVRLCFKLPRTQQEYCLKTITNRLEFIFRVHFLPVGVKPADFAPESGDNKTHSSYCTEIGLHFVCSTKKQGIKLVKRKEVSTEDFTSILSLKKIVSHNDLTFGYAPSICAGAIENGSSSQIVMSYPGTKTEAVHTVDQISSEEESISPRAASRQTKRAVGHSTKKRSVSKKRKRDKSNTQSEKRVAKRSCRNNNV